MSNRIKLMNIVKVSFNSSNNFKNIIFYEGDLGIGLSDLSNLIVQLNYSDNGLWYALKFNYYID